jgi:hypothetical protein
MGVEMAVGNNAYHPYSMRMDEMGVPLRDLRRNTLRKRIRIRKFGNSFFV